jgi:hypothetical protein
MLRYLFMFAHLATVLLNDRVTIPKVSQFIDRSDNVGDLSNGQSMFHNHFKDVVHHCLLVIDYTTGRTSLPQCGRLVLLAS